MIVKIGEVETFQDAKPDKAQVMKILEESAEVFSSWEDWRYKPTFEEQVYLLDECADVIQAICNLIAALEVDDFTAYMNECRKRNEERGRL